MVDWQLAEFRSQAPRRATLTPSLVPGGGVNDPGVASIVNSLQMNKRRQDKKMVRMLRQGKGYVLNILTFSEFIRMICDEAC